jgi:hypothetical protein
MMQRQLSSVWKMKSFVGLVCQSMFLPTTFCGLLNLINYAKIMALDINTLHLSGQGVMGWWKD